MIDTYYLGANTSKGFRSEYGSLQMDPRIRSLTVIKGGPGCGKSTLMGKAAAWAEEQGLAVERIPCSSDPDSLDGVVIPALGRAFVDGTAPHVVEPALCGCGANYLNLGQCYREKAMQRAAPALRAAKAANAACYEPAYGLLRAAGELEKMIVSLANREDVVRAEAQLLDTLPGLERTEGGKPAKPLRCYLDAFTPRGALSLTPEGKRVWILQDSYGLGGEMLRTLAARWITAGAAVRLAPDPLAPDALMGVLAPDIGVICLRSTPVFDRSQVSAVVMPLDTVAESVLPTRLLSRIRSLRQRQRPLLTEALSWLQEAKQHHDELEALCRPAVDFSAVDKMTQTVLEELSASPR